MSRDADITVRLALNATGVAEKFDSVTGDMKRRAQELGAEIETSVNGVVADSASRFSALGAAIPKVAAGFAALAGAAAGVYGLARSLTELGDTIATAADQAQLGIERYQTLTRALERLDVKTADSEQILRRLADTLGDVQLGTASRKAEAALDRLGVRSKILNGEINDSADLLDALAASAATVGDQSEFTASLVDILGRKLGIDFANAVRDSGKALAEQEEAIRKTGTVLDEEYVRQLEAAKKAIARFLETQKNRLVLWAGAVIEATGRVGAELRKLSLLELQNPFGFGGAVVRGLQAPGRSPNSPAADLRAIEALPAGSDARRALEERYRATYGRELPFTARARSGGGSDDIVVRARRASFREEEAALAAEQRRNEAARRSATQAQSRLEREQAAALREAERAREKALARELDLIARQGEAARELLEIVERLEGGFGADFDRRAQAAFRRISPPASIFDGVGRDEIVDVLERAGFREKAAQVTDRFRDDGIRAAQAIAQTFGGSVGGEVARIAGVLRGLQTGDFTSLGGRLGGALTLAAGRDSEFRRALGRAFEPVTAGLERTLGRFARSLGFDSLGGLGSSALAGAGIGALVGRGTGGAVGGGIGGSVGAAAGLAIGGPIGAAIGQLAGSILGGAVGGLFSSPKKGSVTVTAGGVSAATGNSQSRRAAAGQLGGGLFDSLQRIAEALGAEIGSFSVSVGQRDGKFSVDPTGRGMVSRKYGAIQFDTAEEAIRFALRDAINDGALAGLSQTVQNAIRRAASIEQGLNDAVAIQSIGKRLRSYEDPLAAALDDLNDEFRRLEKTLRANGATVSELADLEKLYAKERERLLQGQVSTLKGFLDDLGFGSSSPLSLTEQRRNIEAEFAGFEAAIRGGQAIDAGAFTDAGRRLLGIQEQISGRTGGFFEQFDRVRGLTEAARDQILNSASQRDLFAVKTAEATQSSADSLAEIVNQNNRQLELQEQILASLAAGGYGFVGADPVGRGFVR